MKFGPVRPNEAVGAILAHTVRVGATIRKGTILTSDHARLLVEAGHDQVVVARLDGDDVHEDAAAARIAGAVAGSEVRVEKAATGRANLFARNSGLLIVDRDRIDALNAIDPAITLATLDAHARVEEGRMVATVKIIPFAAPDAAVASAEAVGACIAVKPFVRRRIGMIATMLPVLKETVLDKTRRVLDERLAATGASVVEEVRVLHEPGAIAAAIAQLAPKSDVVLVFGASAVVDIGDVIPAAIVESGGRVDHFGMPVDPGNLLLIGAHGETPVIGAPGCARSPRLNGFDWVLDRVLADHPVTPEGIRGMGVGGLLMEIVTRPQPRDEDAPVDDAKTVGAVVLAAGQSTRMGAENKLTKAISGEAMVRHPVKAALAAGLDPIVVITGHDADAVTAALSDLPVSFTDNPAYADGLSTSLKAGLAALDDRTDAAFVLLGDMPFVTADLLKAMRKRLEPEAGAWIVVPTDPDGRWGNPVLLHRRFFPVLADLTGDRGARAVLKDHADAIAFVTADGEQITRDFDTPASFDA